MPSTEQKVPAGLYARRFVVVFLAIPATGVLANIVNGALMLTLLMSTILMSTILMATMLTSTMRPFVTAPDVR